MSNSKFQAAAQNAKAKFRAAASATIKPSLTKDAVALMQGLEEFSNLGRTAIAAEETIQDALIVEELMGSYLYTGSYWNLKSSTKAVTGTVTVGIPYAITVSNGFAKFEQGPTSEYGCAVGQGTGDIKTLFTNYGDSFPFVAPDFASVGFINKEGCTHATGLVKRAHTPANKVAGASAWSVKLTERSAGERNDDEAITEWRELVNGILQGIVEENGYGEGRHTGYLLLVGFATEVALHAASKAKDENGKLKYANQTPWLSITMPCFAAYTRPLSWNMDVLASAPSLQSFVHKNGKYSPMAVAAVQANEQKLTKTLVSTSPLEVTSTKASVKVVTQAPSSRVEGVPDSWFALNALVKLAVADSYVPGKYLEAARAVNKGTPVLEALTQQGLKSGEVALDVAFKTDLNDRINNIGAFPLRYFKSIIKNRLNNEVVEVAPTQPTVEAAPATRPNRLKKAAQPQPELVVEEIVTPTIEEVVEPVVETLTAEPKAFNKSALKNLLARKKTALEEKLGAGIAPSSAPRIAVAKTVDEYDTAELEVKIEGIEELDSFLTELGVVNETPEPQVAKVTPAPAAPAADDSSSEGADGADDLTAAKVTSVDMSFFM